MNRGRQLRELISKGECVIAPGAYDGLTARLIAQAGFASVYMTGGGTSSGFGYPDYGLLTMSEMVENAGRIVDAVDLPEISDADNGYGNELNVYRTIQTFEKAGVAGVHIEDQVFPKKCGHLEDKELGSLDDYLAKIRAAADARRSDDQRAELCPQAAFKNQRRRSGSRGETRASDHADNLRRRRRPA